MDITYNIQLFLSLNWTFKADNSITALDADLCTPSSSLGWSSEFRSLLTASCRPLILAFFSFSTMTKREYSSLSNASFF